MKNDVVVMLSLCTTVTCTDANRDVSYRNPSVECFSQQEAGPSSSIEIVNHSEKHSGGGCQGSPWERWNAMNFECSVLKCIPFSYAAELCAVRVAIRNRGWLRSPVC
ncbi:fumarylacetoacetate (FAA) hydrolase [Anopheles sinensis]|uniref:Fumarylacetoacetate (FAA) hydrolase n=1 Tax=Anopheles sinensis TaxID=74873 RepID=A0A084VC28_ANOSI|nr:fumarylacetoacetate (FAA) hydrolase [Anopheles sinensis]